MMKLTLELRPRFRFWLPFQLHCRVYNTLSEAEIARRIHRRIGYTARIVVLS